MTQHIIINDELKNLLPPLSPEEFAGLEEDILEHGCLSPMIAWNEILVDGHHRYEICTRHEIPFSIQNIVFDSIDAAKLWAWKHQEHRRNLSPFHRSQLALRFKDTIASKAKERQGNRNDLVQDNIPQTFAESGKETRRELAEIAGVSHTTLAKAEYIDEHADDETKDKLRRGEKGTSINKEYNRLRAEEKAATAKSTTTLETPVETAPQSAEPTKPLTAFAGGTPGFAPGSEEEEKYSPKTQLKPIPRNKPDVLVRNLLAHFPKEFVPNMIRATFKIFVETGEKKLAGELAREIYKAFGRK